MKLNNQQIEAILNVAEANHRKLIQIENNNLKKDKKLIKKAKDIYASFKLIPVYIKDNYIASYNKSLTESKILQDLVNKAPSKVTKFDKYNLRQQIIILSIDTKDIKELYDKLGINI